MRGNVIIFVKRCIGIAVIPVRRDNAPVKLFCPHPPGQPRGQRENMSEKKGGTLEKEVKKGGALENEEIKEIN